MGAEFGMSGAAVHDRIRGLGVVKPVNVFTDAERERLRREYAIYRSAGKVADLAADMGRTVQFLSRQAKELGITTHSYPKLYAQWKYMSEDAARIMFDEFKASPLGMNEWLAKKGFADDGFRAVMTKYWPDEWEHVLESKVKLTTKYRLGREVEYRVRDMLRQEGYFVLRAPASKTPVDLVAIKPGQVLFVQCKRSGTLPPAEWNALFELAKSCAAIPIMAERPWPRMTRFWRLLALKDGGRTRQPMEPFQIDQAKP